MNMMEDPRFCSACGAGPFTHLQNHVNKCRESRKHEIAFMDSTRNVKQRRFTFSDEVVQQRRQPPDPTQQVRALGVQLLIFSYGSYAD
jgi:hypothetical protein